MMIQLQNIINKISKIKKVLLYFDETFLTKTLKTNFEAFAYKLTRDYFISEDKKRIVDFYYDFVDVLLIV